ncbi:MAG TPA: hypothetical protein VIY08_03130, partial [Candidatus Nitrosocosmicus sp.]
MERKVKNIYATFSCLYIHMSHQVKSSLEIFDESIEVSYSILVVEEWETPDDILQKIATLVNVQLGAQD